MVYLKGGEPMLVLDAGENAEPENPGAQTYFIHARALRSIEEETHHAASSREKFRVVEAGSAIRDADDFLWEQIQRNEKDMAALSEPDTDRAEKIARDREQRKWLSDLAEDFGVRLRPAI